MAQKTEQKEDLAFPGRDPGAEGLTKREYFAALALRGDLDGFTVRDKAQVAVALADALIEELNRPKEDSDAEVEQH